MSTTECPIFEQQPKLRARRFAVVSAVNHGLSARRIYLFLISVLLAATVSDLWLVAQLSPHVPKFDDWTLFVPFLTGQESVSARWLWSQANEHRIPLLRLVFPVVFYASGGDFRAGSFLAVVLLTLAAFCVMRTAKQLRGHPSLCDAFIPLLLLQWGQAHTFVMGGTLSFATPAALSYITLALAIGSGPRLSLARGLICASMIALMPMFGMVGHVFAVAWTCWLGCVASHQLLARDTRREGFCFLTSAVVLAGLLGFYLVGYAAPPHHAVNAAADQQGILGRLKMFSILLSMSLGWLGRATWPAGVIFLAALGFLSVIFLLKRQRQAEQGISDQKNLKLKTHYSPLLALMAASLLGLGSLATRRAFIGGEALWFTTRYATIAIMFVVASYLTAVSCFPHRLAQLTQRVLLMVGVVVFCGHVLRLAQYPYDVAFFRQVRAFEDMLIRKAVHGKSSAEIADVPGGYLYGPELLIPLVDGLRAKQMGPFGMSPKERANYLRYWQPTAKHQAVLAMDSAAAEACLDTGWGAAETGGRWTLGAKATVRLALTPEANRTAKLALTMSPFLVPQRVDRQRVVICLNEADIETLELNRLEAATYKVRLPCELLQSHNQLTLRLPDAASPADTTGSSDRRVLAVFVRSLRLESE